MFIGPYPNQTYGFASSVCLWKVVSRVPILWLHLSPSIHWLASRQLLKLFKFEVVWVNGGTWGTKEHWVNLLQLFSQWNMDKRSKLPDPRKGRSSSNRDERRIPFLRYEDELVPGGRSAIWIFRKKGQQLKYVGKESTHTPVTLRAIPSGVLNRLAKLTSRKPFIQAEALDTI